MTKEDAERKIQEILSQLEKDTGSTVEAVNISGIDVTKVGDRKQQIIRYVRIELRSIESRWGT